jgi:hypothetical protein
MTEAGKDTQQMVRVNATRDGQTVDAMVIEPSDEVNSRAGQNAIFIRADFTTVVSWEANARRLKRQDALAKAASMGIRVVEPAPKKS